MDDEERPIAAFVLSLLAGILIFVEGVVLSLAASILGAVGLYAAGNLLGAIGVLGLLVGVVVIVLAIQLVRHPDGHVGYGIAILVLALLSLVAGGGFFLGLILGAIGGILAIVFAPSDELEDPWAVGPPRDPSPPLG